MNSFDDLRVKTYKNDVQTTCKICHSNAELFEILDFNKAIVPGLIYDKLSMVPIYYYNCKNCGFIFTRAFDDFSDIDWKHYVYNDDYYIIDNEYDLIRPKKNAVEISEFLKNFPEIRTGLDYGGGNGLTAKILRECYNLNYLSYDPYGLNDFSSIKAGGKIHFCSLFEVLEHTSRPIDTFRSLLDLCANDKLIIYASTGITDNQLYDKKLSWSYAAPRNGHISLYSRKSLKILCQKFSLEYLSLSSGTHIFYRGYPKINLILALIRVKLKKNFTL